MNIAVAWRNLSRNRQRTTISICALTVGTMALVCVHALWTGFARDVVRSVTQGGDGEAQAHARDYLSDRSIYKSLEDPDALVREAARHGIQTALRSIGYGLVAKGAKSAGAQLIGVDADGERAVSSIPTRVQHGDFLPQGNGRGAVLGYRLAQSIGASVGDELVIVVQAADGSTASELFRLVGVLQPLREAIDQSGVYIERNDFESLFSTGGRVHEVVFQSHGALEPDAIVSRLAASAGTASVETWRQINPATSSMVDVILGMISLIQGFFYLSAGLGVMNTMLMATFDRTVEFGVMKALGCPSARIVADVVLEAAVLGLIGCTLGAALGWQVATYFGTHGINAGQWIGSFSAGGMVFDNVWHPVLAGDAVVEAMEVMCLVVVVAAMYPAIKAARTDPVHAMSHI